MKAYKLALSLILTQLALGASAGPIAFNDRLEFENQGSIAEFQDFESFDSAIFTFPGDPFVDGSVTYTSEGENLIVGADTFVNPISNTMSYDDFTTALTADIGGAFNMFGLDMAFNNANAGIGDVTLTLFTNVADYVFDFTLPEVQEAQLFQGFILTGREVFTGFEFSSLNFVHVDNITLGNAVAVPEPSTLVLATAAILAIGVTRRKYRKLY